MEMNFTKRKFNRLKWIFQSLTLSSIILIGLINSNLQAQINDNGAVHTVGYNGSYQDFAIPMNPAISKISFTLNGGDGGYAQVTDSYPDITCFCETSVTVKSNGGSGSTTNLTFQVGSGANQIPHGSTIRFVVGRAGVSGASNGAVGVGLDYGGGGGGTAVLYKAPTDASFTLIGVAGGGGGAYQGMVAWSSVDAEDGQGGRSGEGGGSGNGDLGPGGGGSSGNGGGGNPGLGSLGGGGGGAFSNGGGVDCISFQGSSINGEGGAGGQDGGYGGNSEGCLSFSWRNGGFGFGGGGAGSGAGGGGGGYSGGGVGGTTGRGGGGGSFMASFRESGSVTAGGNTGSPANGFVNYQVTLNAPPIVSCKNATIYLNANGNASISATDITQSASDPENGPLTYGVNKTTFNCSNVGENTVTLTVTDNAGLTATCTAKVTVIDNIPPTVNTKNALIQLNAAGSASITTAMINNGSTDNCGIQSYALDKMNFNCTNVGQNTVVLTVTDVNGNTASKTATVTVEDKIAPTVITKNATIQLDAMGQASITTAMINNGSTDNCGIQSYALDKMNFNCTNVGQNTVVLTVTDVNGNTASKTATVTVQDNIAPTIVSTTPTPAVLWPPNHKMVPVEIKLNTFDNCAGSACKIISVTSNEPLNSTGDGNTAIDWQITGDYKVDLRAERSGNLVGRVYTITMECTDASGNKTRSTTTVTVPHDQGKKGREAADVEEYPNGLSINVLGNPTFKGTPFVLEIQSNDNTPNILLKTYDGMGRINETIEGLQNGQKLQIGSKYPIGVHYAEVIQNSNRKIIKLLKQ